MVELIQASPAHVRRIANRMRADDQFECRAFGRSPVEGLRASLAASVVAVTAMLDCRPVAMLGVTPINALEGIGAPWMLGTDDLASCARAMLELGTPVIAAMHARFSRLENVVWTGNARAIRTLRALGFEVGEDVRIIGGMPFHPFVRVG